ncbi:MAG TPA: FAD-binding protein, partial [Gammaproteobacteria bacterium]|nr:FAD-binding protein [Gammaproteobacteria bacterium]
MTSPYTLTENASLTHHNTFRVAARAPLFAAVNDPQALPEVLRLPVLRGRALLLLGEGSNILFARDPDMPVLTVTTRGIRVLEESNTAVRVRAEAGEHWHDLVSWSLKQGLCGLENLSLIPGTVGAAPIQNIGAYGAELADVLSAVEAFDRERGELVRLERERCEFSYRQSVFKRYPDRWIITGVELELRRDASLKLDYSGVRDELAAMGIARPTALDVSNAVCRLRLRKLP